MKLLVMGAGYVGMALLTQFKNRPDEIFITTTQEKKIEALKQYGKEVFYLQRSKNEDLKDLIDACDGMVILVAPINSQSYEETYLKTAKTISIALEDRKEPFYILYTSSTSVGEGLHTDWVTEGMTLCPKTENAKILLETERVYLNCRAVTCILRLGGIYGPNREIMQRAMRCSAKQMVGSGGEPTNHVHLDDIIAAIEFCIDHRLKGIYHLVNDDHPTRQELYSSLCRSSHLPPPIWSEGPSRDGPRGYKISNQKIKDAGFIFKHSLVEIKL